MIETKRLKIIPLEKTHLEPLRKMRNDPVTSRWLTDNNYISQKQQQDWFAKISQDETKMYLAVMIPWTPAYLSAMSELVFGGILRSDEWDYTNRSVRAGVDIFPDFRGQGYGTEAFSAFVDYLFEQKYMHRVWLLVAEENKIARKLYKKLGFIEEGRQKQALLRDNRFYDYISMSILEDEWIKKK